MNKKRFLFTLLITTTILLAAPTTIKLGMLLGPVVSSGAILILTPTGQVQYATIGTGLALTSDGLGGFTLTATSGGSNIYGEKLTRQPDGTFVISQTPITGTLRVHRNGVRQSSGDDYTYDPLTKRITPLLGWNTDDLILVDYVR